jgi:hypothetical protein
MPKGPRGGGCEPIYVQPARSKRVDGKVIMHCPICKKVLKVGVVCVHLFVATLAGDGDTFRAINWTPQSVEASTPPSGSTPFIASND